MLRIVADFQPVTGVCVSDELIMGEAFTHTQRCGKHLRLLLFILLPCVCVLICVCVLLALTGLFGNGLLDAGSSVSIATDGPFNSTDPGPMMADNRTVSAQSGTPRVVLTNTPPQWDSAHWMPRADTSSSSSSSSSVGPTAAAPVDWWTSVSTVTSMSADAGFCSDITEIQCSMLPYNQSGVLPGTTVVKSSELQMFLKFFSYLSQLSCYRHIMLFGCSIALPQCISHRDRRTLVLPCQSFCEAAREGCEPVLQMFNASWPEFLRCSQFTNNTGTNAENMPLCYTPRHARGKLSACGRSDHFLCASGICIPLKLVCNGYNDCNDWSDEADCTCADGQYLCTTGRCISSDLLCDGYDDCGDLSDEQNCVCDPTKEHRCGEGRCIPRDWLCDGDHDCLDKSDELNCCEPLHITLTHWVCVLLVSPVVLQPPAPLAVMETRHVTCATLATTAVSGCEPISLEICMNLPYNSTRFPNYLGHHSQKETSVSWESSLFPALVQTNCYKYLMFFACTVLVPMCDPVTQQRVPPCRRESADVWKVVLGINNLDHPSPYMQSRHVKSIIVHSRYNRAVVDYDISVLELETEVEVTSYVRPVCLPGRGQLPKADQYCHISGWGHMGNRMPFKLQEGEVRIISVSQCQSYFDMKTITSRMLCAGYEAGTIDSCMGDSGGPLVCEGDDGRWSLYGLTSWGSVCFSKVLGPGVYANVTHFTEWIERQIYLRTFNLL
ncbi:atrial natriuretic peptide-converting enzyme [Sinocyclocheilus rhinocerous]|uniref:atrial natriuretic peptide-converting enzyme n=1 Tax=Sinocyclocheilus rhinocerous TaxID=307959 RepID=UPI0007B7C3F4|nr:PREDICTED: atrial natriuretic peptide-converting enzyme-like [Sinocyclocheilus rhinocerous]